jgi:hypothetical protein
MKFTTLLRSACTILGLSVSWASLNAQVTVNVGTTYTQNFDNPSFATEVAAAGTGLSTWSFANNSTYAGWMRQVNVGDPIVIDRSDKDYIGEALNTNTARFGNVGNGGSWPEATTDRALMSMIRGASSEISFGVVFQLTGGAATGATVAYTGEQWFRAPNTNTLQFQYKVLNSFNAAAFFINDETGWTDVNSLDFAALKIGSGQKMNGNFTGDAEFGANRTVLTDSITVNLADGNFIAFRWRQADLAAGAAQPGLGIDDFSVTFTAVPEPSTYALFLGLVVLGLGYYRRRLR